MANKSSKTLMGRAVAPSTQVEQILEQQPAVSQTGPAYEQVTQAVLFTDIVGSTSYFEERGDQAGLAMVEQHNQLLFPQVTEHQGTIIKTIGDAIMARFEKASQAVAAAVAMQQALRQFNSEHEEPDQIHVRIGINYGQVLQHEADLFGDVVNAAARVEALGGGDQILISGSVDSALDSDFAHQRSLFDALRVKGKKEPIEVYQVRWDPDQVEDQTADLPRFEAGKVLGDRFEILDQLGEGGMGQVYQARDRALDEVVALKFVRPDLALDDDALKRFKSEVRMARSVTHPNICRIHEFLEMEGRVFLSMEQIEGRTLESLLEEGVLDEQNMVTIARGISAGLQAAHEKGITHRDLKPANVMIEKHTQRVVLMDFGIAQLGDTLGAGEAGLVVGTPEYMSPEQVVGEAVGPASDIYALGVIMYEMTTGRPPHTGDNVVLVVKSHLTDEPEPLRKIRPELSADFTGLVERCMHKEPGKRFPDAQSLILALGGEHIPQGRSLAFRLSLLLLPILVSGLSVAIWLGTRNPGPAAANWHSKVLVSARAVDSYARFSPDGQRLAFLRDGDIWLKDESGKAQQLTRGARALDQENMASLAWTRDGQQLLLSTSSAQGPQTSLAQTADGQLKVHLAGAAGADISHDGQGVAFVQTDEQGHQSIAVAHMDGSQKRVVLQGSTDIRYQQPRWSPDDTRLALTVHQVGYQTSLDIAAFNLDSGKLTMLTSDGAKERTYNTDPVWTSDGAWIVYVSRRSGTMSLWQVPAAGGESVALSSAATSDQRQPDLAPDDQSIVFATHSKQLDIGLRQLGSDSGRDLTRDIWRDRFPAFSPSGSKVAFRAQRTEDDPNDASLILMDLQEGTERELASPAGMREFCWSSEQTMVYAATVANKRSLAKLDLVSGKSQTLVQGFHRIWSPTCAPDGDRVVFSGQKSRSDNRALWQVELSAQEGQEPRHLLAEDRGRHTYPSFSPSGKLLAYRWTPSNDKLGQSELRIIQDGQVITVSKHRSFRHSRRRICFSPDGQTLYYIEAHGRGGRLWSVPLAQDTPSPVQRLEQIHTFDFDLAPDGQSLVYPLARHSGDLFMLQKEDRP